ncbi:MAG: glycosyltransferase [Thermomicrobiales bacterium]
MISVHTSPLSALGGPDAGGLTVYLMSLAEQLAKSGIEVDIFTRRFDTTTPDVVELSPGINLISITAGPPEKLAKDDLYCLLPDFASEMAMYALETGVRYDVIHTHYWLSGWVGRILKRYWDVPVVHMYHTLAHMKNNATPGEQTESALRLRVERELVGTVDQIVAPNPDERAELGLEPRSERLPGMHIAARNRPPALPTHEFLGGAGTVPGLPDAPIVLFVGRIDPIKDIDTLLESMALLIQGYEYEPKPYLAIVGGELDGDSNPVGSLASVAEKANQLGIRDQLIFLGSRPQSELPALYGAASVVAVSSRYESFGLVAVEAMACGTPVVATRVGGMRFTIEEGVSGLLVPPGDPEAMAYSIGEIIRDRDLRAGLQVGARQAAIRFSWHTVGASMLRMYERLVSGDRGVSPCYGTIYAS